MWLWWVGVAQALGVETDCRPGPNSWPTELVEALSSCVHSYAVNNVDVVYARGDTAAASTLLSWLARSPDVGVVGVVVHAGLPVVQSPWGPPLDVTADWRLTLTSHHRRFGRLERVDVELSMWSEGTIDAAALQP